MAPAAAPPLPSHPPPPVHSHIARGAAHETFRESLEPIGQFTASLIGIPCPQPTTLGRSSASFRTERGLRSQSMLKGAPAARQFLFPTDQARPRIHVHGRKRIARQKHPVRLHDKMKRARANARASRSIPVRHTPATRRPAIRAPARPGRALERHEAREKRHRPADRRVRRRISRATRQVRQSPSDGRKSAHPIASASCRGRPGVIEMTMREINRLRPRRRRRSALRRPAKICSARPGNPVSSGPRVHRVADEVGIDETDRQPADIGSNSFDRFHGIRMPARINRNQAAILSEILRIRKVLRPIEKFRRASQIGSQSPSHIAHATPPRAIMTNV